MKLPNWIRNLFVAVPLTVFPGCAGFFSALPEIASVIADANATLSIVERAMDAFFAIHPNAELRQEANRLLSNCWVALRIANSSVEGAKHLNEEERAEAFKDFQDAYEELHTFLKENGILRKSGLGGSHGEILQIPEPTAMKYGR